MLIYVVVVVVVVVSPYRLWSSFYTGREIIKHETIREGIVAETVKQASLRTNLLEEELSWGTKKFEEFKANLRGSPVPPSSKACDLAKVEMKALKAGAFAQKDAIHRDWETAREEDAQRHRAAVERRLQLLDEHLQHQQRETRIRMQQKNRGLEDTVKKEWRKVRC